MLGNIAYHNLGTNSLITGIEIKNKVITFFTANKSALDYIASQLQKLSPGCEASQTYQFQQTVGMSGRQLGSNSIEVTTCGDVTPNILRKILSILVRNQQKKIISLNEANELLNALESAGHGKIKPLALPEFSANSVIHASVNNLHTGILYGMMWAVSQQALMGLGLSEKQAEFFTIGVQLVILALISEDLAPIFTASVLMLAVSLLPRDRKTSLMVQALLGSMRGGVFTPDSGLGVRLIEQGSSVVGTLVAMHAVNSLFGLFANRAQAQADVQQPVVPVQPAPLVVAATG